MFEGRSSTFFVDVSWSGCRNIIILKKKHAACNVTTGTV